jgi:hypothetical protein
MAAIKATLERMEAKTEVNQKRSQQTEDRSQDGCQP